MKQERKPQRKKSKGKSWNTENVQEKPLKSSGYKKPKSKEWESS